ncbi:muskelin-like [Diaphorina citri]|uniref:Muskelin-like n=1 Tax=Diaphorina citri TaxID=121845 RepID=A0A3Q0JIV1_DIACI|nr:muskelin-like [Diaphorina citri]
MAECKTQRDEGVKMKKLEYSVHSYSSYSTTYVPENIKVDKSMDQSSRWSSDSNFPPQVNKSLAYTFSIRLEHPLLTQLFNVLVHEGDYEQVEQLMTNAINNDYLAWYISQQDYRPTWTPVDTPGPRPGMRGGHQMTLDPQTETIYLLGGWDGTQDLSDFWSYSIRDARWTLICPNVEYVVSDGP